MPHTTLVNDGVTLTLTIHTPRITMPAALVPAGTLLDASAELVAARRGAARTAGATTTEAFGRLGRMLRWYGHRSSCPRPRLPDYRGPHLLVCVACMPDHDPPSCPLCRTLIPRIGAFDGFVHYAFTGLCPTCVAKVLAAGPARERRARANEARVDALVQRFPTLAVSERARNRTQLDGVIDGRAVRLTLRISPRGGSDERYVFRVELHGPVTSVTPADLQLDPRLVAGLNRRSPKLTASDHRWLHASFRHLGKLDTVWVLEGLLASAAALDARAGTTTGAR